MALDSSSVLLLKFAHSFCFDLLEANRFLLLELSDTHGHLLVFFDRLVLKLVLELREHLLLEVSLLP